MSRHAASGRYAEGGRYAESGVDYTLLDESKRVAAAAALATTGLLKARGGLSLDQTRGEPAFAFQLGDRTLAIVLECLGTKSTIARQYLDATGIDRFADIGYDAVAAIVNDLCCVGALPLVVNAYFATGSSAWQHHASGRYRSLVRGWEQGCVDAGAVWGGGETPSLTGIIDPEEIDIAGSAIGEVPAGRRALTGEDITSEDEIVLVASSGIHANGASLARRIAADAPDGYETRLPSGRTFGDAVLDPSLMYVRLVDRLMSADQPIRYFSHITGHGLRKLMRARREVTYRLTSLPRVPEVIDFMIEAAGMDQREACATFNMGAGFAVICAAGSGEGVVTIARDAGYDAVVAGYVEEGPRRVVIDPLRVRFESGDFLSLR